MTHWEYIFIVLPHSRTTETKVAGQKVLQVPQIDAILDALGAEGWEVCGFGIVPVSSIGGVGDPRFVLKRPIED